MTKPLLIKNEHVKRIKLSIDESRGCRLDVSLPVVLTY